MPGIDEVDRKLLKELRKNGRITLTELGHKLGLSPASVRSRLGKLERMGAVKGYTAIVDPTFLDEFVQAIIEVEVISEANLDGILIELGRREEVLAIYRKTGEYQLMIKASFKSPAELKKFIEELSYRHLRANMRRYRVSVVLDEIKENGVLIKAEKKGRRGRHQ